MDKEMIEYYHDNGLSKRQIPRLLLKLLLVYT